MVVGSPPDRYYHYLILKLMQIEVKYPQTGALLRLEAKHEQIKSEHGFRIRHTNGSTPSLKTTSC
jgi:hypothetical protein